VPIGNVVSHWLVPSRCGEETAAVDGDDGARVASSGFSIGGTYRTPWWTPWLYIVPTLVAGACAGFRGPYQGWAAVLAAIAAALLTWVLLNLLGFVVVLLSTTPSFLRARRDTRRSLRDLRRFRRDHGTE
jgi:hypothetical protein